MQFSRPSSTRSQLFSFVNILRWNFLSQNCNIFSVLSIFTTITQPRQIIMLLLLNNFCPVISCRRVQKESDELEFVVYGLVTRYGPQSVASANGWNETFKNLMELRNHFSSNVDGHLCQFHVKREKKDVPQFYEIEKQRINLRLFRRMLNSIIRSVCLIKIVDSSR